MSEAPFPYDHNQQPHEEPETNPGDWIALSRKVREHPIVGCGQPVKPENPWKGAFSRFEAWFDLLCLAQYKPSRINNKGEVITLDVGQLMGALPFLSGRWNWTTKTVRGFLSTLEHERMITASTGENEKTDSQKGSRQPNKCRVITICNYLRYQQMSDAIDQYIRQARGQAEGSQRAGDGQAKGSNLTLTTSTTEQVDTLSDIHRTARSPTKSKARPARVYSERFEEFWRAYPDRTNNSKPAAAEQFDRLDAASQATAITSLVAFASYCRANPDYRCVHAERYLKDRRFESFNQQAESSDPWWKDPAKVALITDDQWRGSISKYANGVWPPERLGPAPGNPRCVVPQHIITELRLLDRYTDKGISKEKH